MRRALAALMLVAASAAVAGPLPIARFASIEEGMGEQRVLALVGFPNAEGTYRPRLDRLLSVIGLGDTYRTYFYRGMGRVLFDGGNQLRMTGKVVKVEVDPEEPGTRR